MAIPSGSDHRPPVVLLTGATGWLGRRLVCALTEGLPDYPRVFQTPGAIRALVPAGEDTRELRARGIEPVFGDLRDSDALRSLTQRAEGGVLIHVAGVVHPPGRTALFDEVNHRGTVRLLDAARAGGLARMVVMSSNSPMGANASPNALMTEESPYNPYMEYGRSKWRMEEALRRAMEAGGRPDIVIIRAPWFYGPEQPPRQTLFFHLVRKGKFPIVGDGNNKRSMSYTDNLAHGLLLATTHRAAPGQIFWMADERAYAMNEIVSTVADVLRSDFGLTVSNRRPRVPGVVSDVARLTDRLIQGVGLYHQQIHVLSEMNLTIACSIEKAKAMLGYRPIIGLREGMRRSVAWCLESGARI